MEGQGASPRRRLALLIDAENISDAGLVRRLLDLLGRHGEVRIRRAYGDWSGERLRRWREALVQHAIQAMQVFPGAAGKNAADIALVVDAMDLLHGGGVDGFCLLASDSDYTRLVVRLREADRYVIVAGRDSTPLALRAAADLFVAVEPLGEIMPAAVLPSPEQPLPMPKPAPSLEPSARQTTDPVAIPVVAEEEPVLMRLVRKIVPATAETAGPAAAGMPEPPETPPLPVTNTDPKSQAEIRNLLCQALADGQWVTMSALGSALRQLVPGFSTAQFGFPKLWTLILAHGDLIDHRPGASGPIGEVRLTPAAVKPDPSPLLRQALASRAWMTLAAAGTAIRACDPGFDVKRYGHAQLQKLLRAHPQLVECRPASGTVQHVRLRA